jgi:hypothetical protein
VTAITNGTAVAGSVIPVVNSANQPSAASLNNSIVVPAVTMSVPTGSTVGISTNQLPANIGFQLSSVVPGAVVGQQATMLSGIIPVAVSAGGSSITTSSQVVVPQGTNTLTYGTMNANTFTSGMNNVNNNALAPIVVNTGAAAITRVDVARKPIYLCGMAIKFNNNGAGITTIPSSQIFTLAQEFSTDFGTTNGSKLVLTWDGITGVKPLDGKVKMNMIFYNQVTGALENKTKYVNVVGNTATITDDMGTYPQFTHFAFNLDVSNSK